MEYTTNLNLKKPEGTDPADITDINDNMDTIDAGVKKKQTAKTDPTASGTALSFIATISQNANGDITATKKTVSDATSSAHGLMTAAEKTKLAGVANGATANVGTITGITMNGASKGTSGVVNLGTVKTAWRDYKVLDYTGPSISIDGNSNTSLMASQFSIPTIVAGYTPVAITSFTSGNRYVHVSFVDAKATNLSIAMELRNVDNSAKNCTPKISILYLQTGT